MVILIVEDNPDVSGWLRDLLGRHGYSVIVANGVIAAMRVLSIEEKPDVVILDIMLPDGSGIEVLKYIRTNDMPTRVIVMSGCLHDSAHIQAVEALKPDSILIKPTDFDLLLSTIDKHKPA